MTMTDQEMKKVVLDEWDGDIDEVGRNMLGMGPEMPGFCWECGAFAGCCEPDMEGGECEACGEHAVEGLANIFMRVF